MGVAVNVIIRRDQEISFVDLFVPHGFETTVSARKLADGTRTPVYKFTRGKERFSFILLPIKKDPDHIAILLLTKPRHSDLMIWAKDMLQKHGAISQEQYEVMRR